MKGPEELKQFAQQLTALQRPLFVYITSLVGHPADAEDILQESNRVIWEKLDEHQPGSSLAAWAYKIAYFEVLTFRKRQGRARLRFAEGTLELLAQEMAAAPEQVHAEREALHRCLEKLPENDRELITFRYLGECSLQALASRLRRSGPSLCRSLARIRALLLECIRRTTAAEVSP